MNLRQLSRFLLMPLVASSLLGQSISCADNAKPDSTPTPAAASPADNEKAAAEIKKIMEQLAPNPQNHIHQAAMTAGGIGLAWYLGYKIHKKAQEVAFEENHPYLKYFIDELSPWISWGSTIAGAIILPKKLRSWGFVNRDTADTIQMAAMAGLATVAQTEGSALFSDDFKPIIPSKKMKDLAGKKDPAIERLVEYLDSQVIRNAYKKNNTAAYKGILLYGPPGTGKTATAQAIAGQTGLPLFVASIADIENKWFGESPKKIKTLFKKAKKQAVWDKMWGGKGVAIIFLDEIDSIARKRDGGHDASNSILNTLLGEMDGVNPCSNVIVIACTNMPQQLDPAITRPGRFDKVLTINLPNPEQRAAILDLYLSKKESYEHHYDRQMAAEELEKEEKLKKERDEQVKKSADKVAKAATDVLTSATGIMRGMGALQPAPVNLGAQFVAQALPITLLEKKKRTDALIQRIVKITEGASAATLKEIIEEAARRMIHDHRSFGIITDELIEQVALEMVRDPLRGTHRDAETKRTRHADAENQDAEIKLAHSTMMPNRENADG